MGRFHSEKYVSPKELPGERNRTMTSRVKTAGT